MGGRRGRVLDAVRRRAGSLFSRANLLRAAAGAVIGAGCLAAGSALGGEGLDYVLPSGVVHFGLAGASLSLLLRECFAVARGIHGAWRSVLSGAVLGAAFGILWLTSLAGFHAMSWDDWTGSLLTAAIGFPWAGALVSLWIRAPGPRAGLFHSVLKGVASAWLVIILSSLIVFGIAGHTEGGLRYSLSWMWLELGMTFDVTLALIVGATPFALPPVIALAALLWFRDRPRSRPGPVSEGVPVSPGPGPAAPPGESGRNELAMAAMRLAGSIDKEAADCHRAVAGRLHWSWR